jgi:hypothetical protein
MFLRRLGPDPHAHGAKTAALSGCPDILELENGDFAIIGTDITEAANKRMFITANCGPEERVVQIPRATLIRAKRDIPEEG